MTNISKNIERVKKLIPEHLEGEMKPFGYHDRLVIYWPAQHKWVDTIIDPVDFECLSDHELSDKILNPMIEVLSAT